MEMLSARVEGFSTFYHIWYNLNTNTWQIFCGVANYEIYTRDQVAKNSLDLPNVGVF